MRYILTDITSSATLGNSTMPCQGNENACPLRSQDPGMSKPRVEVDLQLPFGLKATRLDLRAVRLLELIEAHGSMTHAATALGISYRTAWILVDKLQQCGLHWSAQSVEGISTAVASLHP